MKSGRIKDRAYLAATIDCEGSISIIRTQQARETTGLRGGKGVYWSVQIQVSNTKYDLISWLCDNYGGRKYFRDRGSPRKPSWTWMVQGPECKIVLEAAFPFMKLKQPQAEIAIDFIETIGTYGTPISDEDSAFREMCHEELKILNKRGR